MAIAVGILIGGVLAVLLANARLSVDNRNSRGALHVSTSSLICVGATLLLLGARGSHDWSSAFAAAWWALLAAAVVLSFTALGLLGRCRPAQRLVVVALALPALVTLPIILIEFIRALGAAAD